MRFIGLMIIAMMLGACGQKGPLYLPSETSERGSKTIERTTPAADSTSTNPSTSAPSVPSTN